MQVGICLGRDIDFAGQCAEAGYDYIEMAAAYILDPRQDDAQWAPTRDKLLEIPLPLPVLNLLFAPDLTLVGPKRDTNQNLEFAEKVFERARLVGAGTIVFGSGKARTPPDGYDLQQARDELVDLARRLGPPAARYNIVLVMEHLCAAESSLLTTIAETLDFVRLVDHPNVRLLIDGYHAAQMNESFEIARQAGPLLLHVHAADGATRFDPVSAKTDLRSMFHELKAAGYDSRISLECRWADKQRDLAANCRLLKEQWQQA